MTIQDLQHLPGHDAIGSDGHKVGNVELLLLDKDTEQPVVAVIATGILGVKVTMVPLEGTGRGPHGELLLPYDKALVHSAPHHDSADELSAAEEKTLFEHFGVRYPGGHGASRTLGRWYTASPPPSFG